MFHHMPVYRAWNARLCVVLRHCRQDVFFRVFGVYSSMSVYISEILGCLSILLGIMTYATMPSGGISPYEKKLWRRFIITSCSALMAMLVLTCFFHFSGRLLDIFLSCIIDSWLLYFLWRRVKLFWFSRKRRF